jgi:large conductance mechanosensitive channel
LIWLWVLSLEVHLVRLLPHLSMMLLCHQLVLLLGGVDFKNLKIMLKAGTTEGEKVIEPVYLSYGAFINTVVEFVIVAFVIFLAVKTINAMKKKEEAAPKPPAADIQLLTEIRDLLKK